VYTSGIYSILSKFVRTLYGDRVTVVSIIKEKKFH
jgi:hypothetical protein